MSVTAEDLAAIQRRQRIAEMLMTQAQEPIQTGQVSGGYVVPVTPLQGLSKVAQALTGAYLGRKADDAAREYKKKQIDALSSIDWENDPTSQLAKSGLVEEAIKMRIAQANSEAEAKAKGEDFILDHDRNGNPILIAKRGGFVRSAPLDESGQPYTGGSALYSPPAIARRENAKKGQQYEKYVDPNTGGESYRPITEWNPGAYPDYTGVMRGLIDIESGGDKDALSTAGAKGLTQIMPETAKRPGYGVKPMSDNSPDEQIRFGADYLRALIKHYGGDVEKGLAAYNGGAGNINIPETRNYAKDVLERSGILQGRSEESKMKAELPIKIAEEQQKADISKKKEIDTYAMKKEADVQIEAKKDYPQAKANSDYMKGLIDELISHPGLQGVVGLPSPLKYIPGTKEQGFRAKLEQLSGKNFLEAFQSLKGGGQITEIEGKKATAAIAALNESQSEEDFKRELLKLKSVIDSANKRLAQKAGDSDGVRIDNPQQEMEMLRNSGKNDAAKQLQELIDKQKPKNIHEDGASDQGYQEYLRSFKK